MIDPAQPASTPLRVVLLTGGHAYQRAEYLSMLGSDPALQVTHVEHAGPTASGWEHGAIEDCDAVLLYDLQQHITLAQRDRFLGLLARGVGLVVTHHALVSFQGWADYERITGGRYVDGAPGSQLGSRYRLDVEVPVQVVDRAHPVTRGLPDFTLQDEIYIGFRVDEHVTPLLVTSQPESGNPIAWTRREGAARIVYIQPGHGLETYASPCYRQLLGNALRYVARSGRTGERTAPGPGNDADDARRHWAHPGVDGRRLSPSHSLRSQSDRSAAPSSSARNLIQ